MAIKKSRVPVLCALFVFLASTQQNQSTLVDGANIVAEPRQYTDQRVGNEIGAQQVSYKRLQLLSVLRIPTGLRNSSSVLVSRENTTAQCNGRHWLYGHHFAEKSPMSTEMAKMTLAEKTALSGGSSSYFSEELARESQEQEENNSENRLPPNRTLDKLSVSGDSFREGADEEQGVNIQNMRGKRLGKGGQRGSDSNRHKKGKGHHQRLCSWSEGCGRQATYGTDNGVTLFCLEHKQDHHKNVRSRKCRAAEGCSKQAIYGDPLERLAKFCNGHREPSHVNVVSPQCQEASCTRQPVFGAAGQQAVFCLAHKRPGDVKVAGGRRCLHAGCSKQSAFGDPSSGVAEYCLEHRPSALYVNLIAKRCEASGCSSRPSFGAPNSTVARFCSSHKPPSFINVYTKRCNVSPCTSQASYGLVGARKPLRCALHRRPDMVHMWGLCQHEGCTINASLGSIEDGVRRFCARHADRAVHVPLRSRIVVRQRQQLPLSVQAGSHGTGA